MDLHALTAYMRIMGSREAGFIYKLTVELKVQRQIIYQYEDTLQK